jgi:hypothetical protein
MKNSLETEKDLKEFYETGDVQTARAIIKDHFAGNLEYTTAARDLVTRVATMVNEGKLVPNLASPLITSVVVNSRKTDEKNPQTWRWASDAQYALRILAETPDFVELGYDQAKIEELANHFNKKYADREYNIGGFSYTSPKTGEIVRINPIVDRAA